MDTQANVGHATARWIRLAWLMVFGGFIAIASPAQAYHHDHDTTRLHNKQIHYAATGHTDVDEDFCTQVVDSDGTLSENTLRGYVDDALLTQAARWDGAGSWKLDMYHTASNCFDPIYGVRDSIEVQYRTYKYQTSGKPCADGISCVTHYNAVWSGTNHNDYLNQVVWLDQDHMNYTQATRRQLLSHETGHVVGFRDPDYNGHCMANPSVMHIPYYGCADPGSGPSVSDLNTLANDIMLSQ